MPAALELDADSGAGGAFFGSACPHVSGGLSLLADDSAESRARVLGD